MNASPPRQSGPVRIAVDIGDTFTDPQILDAHHGRVVAWKTPTTPADSSEGLRIGVRAAAARFGFALEDVGLLLHGTGPMAERAPDSEARDTRTRYV